MPPRQRIWVLAPSDLKPGSIAPDGRVVKRATLTASAKAVVASVEFTDNTSGAYMWPSGFGWTVDGRKAE
jgi:hypothetical protein